jgi:hypothetical protein
MTDRGPSIVEDIVAQLASSGPPLKDTGFGETVCALCGGEPDDHSDLCAWRRAAEYIRSKER